MYRISQASERNASIFDPLIPPQVYSDKDYNSEAIKETKYEMAKYIGKRYDLEKMPERLLVSPPPRIAQHIFKDEVINYVLDKAFLEQPLKAELV